MTAAQPLRVAMIGTGFMGEVRQVRTAYLQDWLVDENGPMTWRLDKKLAGSGSLGDIGAHAVDAVQFITGQAVEQQVLHAVERSAVGNGIWTSIF